jgi:hypothetical protein
MANKVLLKKSSVAARVPTTSDLDYGELALNYADGKLYYKTSTNTIKSFTEDASVVTLAGTQTLTNKTLTSPTITSPTLSGGTINNTVIGGSTPAAITGTTITASTGNVTAAVNLVSNFSSGDEGGEIQLNKPATNTTLVSGVTIDVYQNKLRIFESGGTNRGAYIDLSAAGTSVGSSLLSGGTTVNSFSNIAVSGQTTVAADSSTDTLTLVAGEGITLTTDAGSDSITITGSGAYSGLQEISQTGISTSTTVNSVSATTYRAAKYTIQITNSTSYAMYEFFVMHDGTGVYFPYSSNAYAADTGSNFQNFFSGDYLDTLATTKIQVGSTHHALNWSLSGGNLVFSAACTSGTISIKGAVLLIKA